MTKKPEAVWSAFGYEGFTIWDLRFTIGDLRLGIWDLGFGIPPLAQVCNLCVKNGKTA